MPRRVRKTVRKVQKPGKNKGLGEFVRKIRMEESYASLFLGFAVVALVVVLLFSYYGHKRPTQSISSTSTEQLTGQQIENSLSPTVSNEQPTVTFVPTIAPTSIPTTVPTRSISSGQATPTKVQPSETPVPTTSIEVQKTVEMGGNMYTVKDGDTLWDIAQNVYSSGFLWHKIADANKITDPTEIKPGMTLAIPRLNSREVAQITGSEQQSQVQPSINSDRYTVVHGDTLWDIAVRRYGDGFRWVDIARLNNLVHPNLIFSGNVLNLPKS